MVKKVIPLSLLVVLLALALSALFAPAPPVLAQNITSGRWASDSGNPVYGYGTATDTTAQTMGAAPGAGNSLYIYWASCVNTSASTVSAALLKGGSTSLTVISCPAASGPNPPVQFNPPIRVGANATFTMEATASATTMYFTAHSRTARFQ